MGDLLGSRGLEDPGPQDEEVWSGQQFTDDNRSGAQIRPAGTAATWSWGNRARRKATTEANSAGQ
jgi:hypothetical protein